MKSGSSNNASNMKVTVCFGDVRVVVPCGRGDLLVRDLRDDAILKYRKAAQLLSNWKISIRRLKLGADGGILDEEDRVADVIEDKDQIIADFEAFQLDAEEAGSAADAKDNVRNPSPASLALNKTAAVHTRVRSLPDFSQTGLLKTDVISQHSTDFNSNWMMNTTPKNSDMPNISESDISANWSRTVNDGTSPSSALTSHHQTQHQQHRQAPVLKKILKKPKDDVKKDDVSRDDSPECRSDSAVSSPDVFPSSFVRDSSRKSLSNQLVMAKWLDAQERTVDSYESEHQSRASSAHVPSAKVSVDDKLILTSPQPASICGTGFIHLRNRNVDSGESMTSGWRSSFYGTPSASPVSSNSIPQYLSLNTRKKRPAPEPPSPLTIGDSTASFSSTPVAPPRSTTSRDKTKDSSKLESSLPAILVTSTSVENKENETSGGRVPDSSSLASASSSNIVKSSSPETKFSSDQKPAINKLTPSKKGVLAPTNTRLIGRKIAIQLKKGANGLGFSITTRDNVAGSECPIYIKNILPVGAAVEDGRLTAGDRLLEVNGMEMTGKTQNEAVQVLRGIPVNGTVDILVSRQVLAEDESDGNSEVKNLDVNTAEAEIGLEEVVTTPDDALSIRKELVSSLPVTEPDVIEKDMAFSSEEEHDRNLVTFDIPFSSSNPMLGISFNMALQGGRDLGIFVQKVTLKDGPLLVNDQLVEVNGISLRGLTNSKAIQIVGDALRHHVPGSDMHFAVLRPKTKQSTFFASFKRNQETIGCQSDKATSLIQPTNDAELFKKNLGSAEDSSNDENRTVKENDVQNSLDFKSSQKSSDDFKEVFEDNVQSAEDYNRDSCDSKFAEDLADRHILTEQVNRDFIADESFDDVNLAHGFAREGFGRQSISEKRKGHADPSNLDIYQKIKLNKMTFDSGSWDPRKSTLHKSAGSRRDDFMPKFSTKKCKSLENLHGFDQQMELLAEQVEAAPAVRGNNASFLVAVDRSYVSPRLNPMLEPDYDSLRTKDSILTLSKAPLIPGLMKSDRKTDMEKIRNLIKKGTDMLRFSKRRKSAADSKDEPEPRRQPNVGVVSWGSKKMEGNAVTPQLKSDARSGMAANAADSEPRQGDCYPALPAEHGSELEITHFGAECVTKVVKDGSEWIRTNAAAAEKRSSPGEQVVKTSADVKLNKLQQLRAQYQRFHRERRGQYPLDDVQDQYEQQLQDQERNLTTSSQPSLSTWYSPSQPTEERSRRTQTRSRPQPISVQPEISAQLEYPTNNAESSYLAPSYSYYPPSDFQNYHHAAYVHNPYFYTIPDEGQDLSILPSAESDTHYNAQLYGNSFHDSRTVASTGLPQNGLTQHYNHVRQSSSPPPTSPAVPCSGDRRHSYSERLPNVSVRHLETGYDQLSAARSTDYGAIVSQSSRV